MRSTINVLQSCSAIDFLPQEQGHFPLLHRPSIRCGVAGEVSEPTILVWLQGRDHADPEVVPAERSKDSATRHIEGGRPAEWKSHVEEQVSITRVDGVEQWKRSQTPPTCA